jgi:hypothetical protein
MMSVLTFWDRIEDHKKLPLGFGKDVGGVNPAEVLHGFYAG